MKELFKQPYDDTDPNWILKAYFDIMYSDGDFIKVVELMVDRIGFSTDGAYCHFHYTGNDDEGNSFEGVYFAYGYPPEEDEEIIVKEEVCYQYMRRACELYLKRHPKEKAKINELLTKIPVD